MNPVLPSVLVGLEKQIAYNLLQEAGVIFRIIVEDGQYNVMTRDVIPTRMNLILDKGIVMNAAYG